MEGARAVQAVAALEAVGVPFDTTPAELGASIDEVNARLHAEGREGFSPEVVTTVRRLLATETYALE